MSFFDDVTLVTALLHRDGRLTYRGLQRDFGFDAALLDDVRRELIFRRIAVDEQGEALVSSGVSPLACTTPALSASSLPPLNLAAASSSESATATQSRMEPEVERRQLTVMCCDLVGSTALSAELDPEDLREVIRAYQSTAAEAVTRFEGHIAQYLGDGLLVYFGYPRAHEDDAQRAVYAGLEITAAMDALNARLTAAYDIQLAVRIGIHTGLVVLGEMSAGDRREQLALGQTPNIAARIENLARPNAIVLSDATARLVRRTFALENLDSYVVKGIAEPLRVWSVLGIRNDGVAEA